MKLVENEKEVNKQVAFVKGNRTVDNTKLKNLRKSIEYVNLLTPLLYVTGEKALADNCILIDAVTGDEVPRSKAFNYIVIVDGQHRFKAILSSDAYEIINIPVKQYTGHQNTLKLISEVNIYTKKWSAKDYAKVAATKFYDNKNLRIVTELLNEKYPISTVSKIFTYGSKLTSTLLAKSMNTGKININTFDYDKGVNYIKAVKAAKFSPNFVKRRYLIDIVLDLNKMDYTSTQIYNAFGKLTKEEIISIEQNKNLTKDKSLNMIKNHIIAATENNKKAFKK